MYLEILDLDREDYHDFYEEACKALENYFKKSSFVFQRCREVKTSKWYVGE